MINDPNARQFQVSLYDDAILVTCLNHRHTAYEANFHRKMLNTFSLRNAASIGPNDHDFNYEEVVGCCKLFSIHCVKFDELYKIITAK